MVIGLQASKIISRPLMSAFPYTVIAADDHPVVLSGIRLALRGTDDFTLLGKAADAATTLAVDPRAGLFHV